jgi:hypothetical protein
MTQFTYAPDTVILPNSRISEAIRYGGVVAVWLGVTAVQPRLGMEIWRNRRPDSPLRRRTEQRIPSQIGKSAASQPF